jgi:hypothetical protein
VNLFQRIKEAVAPSVKSGEVRDTLTGERLPATGDLGILIVPTPPLIHRFAPNIPPLDAAAFTVRTDRTGERQSFVVSVSAREQLLGEMRKQVEQVGKVTSLPKLVG